MTKKYLLGAGAALALSLVAAQASAQNLEPPMIGTSGPQAPAGASAGVNDTVPESQCAPASQARNAAGVYIGCRTTQSEASGPGRPLERYVVVRGARHELIRPDPENPGQFEPARWTEPEAARYLAREDDHTVFSEAEWVSLGWSREQFTAIYDNNQHMCSATADYVVRLTSLAERYAMTMPEVISIRDRYVDLRDDIVTAGRTRTGSNIFSSALAWIFGTPLTGAIVTSGAVGNEAQGRAWDRSMMLSRDAGVLNAELTGMHVEYNLLSLEVYVSYLSMMTGYCTMVYSGD